MDIGREIKKLRNKANLTQTEFATKISITQTSLSQLEGNRKLPSQRTLKAISSLFNTTPAMILLNAIDIDNDLTPEQRTLFHAHFPNFSERINEMIGSYKGE